MELTSLTGAFYNFNSCASNILDVYMWFNISDILRGILHLFCMFELCGHVNSSSVVSTGSSKCQKCMRFPCCIGLLLSFDDHVPFLFLLVPILLAVLF